MYDHADKVLKRWIAAVNAGDLETVLSMYAESSLLLPTFSSEVRGTPDGIRDYFQILANNDKVEVTLDEESKVLQRLSDHVYTLGGLYTWHIVDSVSEKTFVARYTFMMDMSAERPIVHHHSSLVPD
jgi:hypothetical protein